MLALIVAFVLSVLLGWLSINLGQRLGLVDLPDAGLLKGHSGRPVPLGGLGIIVGLHVGLALQGIVEPGLLAATALLWVVGIADDRAGLDPRLRLAAAATSGLLLGGLQEQFPGWLMLLAYVVVVAVVVNSVNLFDGLDALAGSSAVVGAASLALFTASRGHAGAIGPLVLAAAVLGFLMWNRPPARLFLGDNGAYVVGAALAWAALRFSTRWDEGVVALALVGAPLLDFAATILRRIRSRATLFGGDRDHSYDRLHRAGWSVASVAAIFTLAQIAWTSGIIALSIWLGIGVAAFVAIAGSIAIAVWLGLWSGTVPSRRSRARDPGSPG